MINLNTHETVSTIHGTTEKANETRADTNEAAARTSRNTLVSRGAPGLRTVARG